MKTNAKLLLVVCLVLIAALSAKAQRRADALPQPKMLADMMLTEKKAGQFNDSLYVTYLVDSLHFIQKEMTWDEERRAHQLAAFRGITQNVFVKNWERSGREESIELTISSQANKENGQMLRTISIQATNHTTIWWMLVRLKEFGMKQTEGEGDFIDLKGKGLFAGTGHGQGKYAGMGMHSIEIGCWFDNINQLGVAPDTK